jgi:hypothetical protein
MPGHLHRDLISVDRPLLPVAGIAKSLAVQPPMKSVVKLSGVLTLGKRKLGAEASQERLRQRASLGHPVGLSSLTQRVPDHRHQAAQRDGQDRHSDNDLDKREPRLATVRRGSSGRDARPFYGHTKVTVEHAGQRTSRRSQDLYHLADPTYAAAVCSATRQLSRFSGKPQHTNDLPLIVK